MQQVGIPVDRRDIGVVPNATVTTVPVTQRFKYDLLA